MFIDIKPVSVLTALGGWVILESENFVTHTSPGSFHLWKNGTKIYVSVFHSRRFFFLINATKKKIKRIKTLHVGCKKQKIHKYKNTLKKMRMAQEVVVCSLFVHSKNREAQLWKKGDAHKYQLIYLKETKKALKLTVVCVANTVSSVSECMREKTVCAMLFSARKPTKEQLKSWKVSQGGEPHTNPALRAFAEHGHAGPRCCQRWWLETSYTFSSTPATKPQTNCHTDRLKRRRGAVGHHACSWSWQKCLWDTE